MSQLECYIGMSLLFVFGLDTLNGPKIPVMSLRLPMTNVTNTTPY